MSPLGFAVKRWELGVMVGVWGFCGGCRRWFYSDRNGGMPNCPVCGSEATEIRELDIPTGRAPEPRAKPSVLLVDDEEDIRFLLRLALERDARCDVVAEAEDAEAALALATQHQPDVVVLDWWMPRRSGLDIVPDLRVAAPGCRIVVLTAQIQPDAAEAAAKAGADAFLEKGSSLTELAATVVRLGTA